MPIGFDPGDGGYTTPPPATAPPTSGDPLDPWGHDGAPPPETESQGSWGWVEVEQEEVTEVRIYAWATQEDGRVCPECGPLDGELFDEGEGIFPPLHPGCRCARVYVWSEWRTRPVTVWEETWIPA
jgi:hypothetical protein